MDRDVEPLDRVHHEHEVVEQLHGLGRGVRGRGAAAEVVEVRHDGDLHGLPAVLDADVGVARERQVGRAGPGRRVRAEQRVALLGLP